MDASESQIQNAIIPSRPFVLRFKEGVNLGYFLAIFLLAFLISYLFCSDQHETKIPVDQMNSLMD